MPSKKIVESEVIEKLFVRGIHVIGPCKSSRSKCCFKCTTCGYQWWSALNNVLRGTGCRECVRKKATTPRDLIESKINPRGISIVGEYVNTHTNTTFYCSSCNYKWRAKANSILAGSGCPECKRKKLTKSQLEVSAIIEARGIYFVEPYVRTNIKTVFGCRACGNQWQALPNGVVFGSGCPKCWRKRHSQNKTSSQSDVETVINKKQIYFVTPYVAGKIKSTFCCGICTHEWYSRPETLLRGRGCPKCAIMRRTTSRADAEYKLATKGFCIMGEYKNSRTKCLIKHECGHLWEAQPRVLINNKSGCPACAPTGFNPNLPATLYLFHLVKPNGIQGIGYGISNVLKKRNYYHGITFRKTNTSATLIHKIDYEKGSEAYRLELILKQHPDNFDFGIDGFRTECLPVKHKDWILKTISQTELLF